MKLILEKGQNIFFTSDTHYSHSNICRATSKWGDDNLTRDFKSLDQMNTELVNNINEIVGENDILIHLGDWSFGGFENIADIEPLPGPTELEELNQKMGEKFKKMVDVPPDYNQLITDNFDDLI